MRALPDNLGKFNSLGKSMKCDMELVRAILLTVEAQEHSGQAPRDLTTEGYTPEQVGHHC
jgi:hypothetical protein